MIIAKRRIDNVVLFQGDSLVLTGSGIFGDDWTFGGLTTGNGMLETVTDMPADWAVGAYSHAAGVWHVVDPSLLPAGLDRQALGRQIDDAVAATTEPYTRFAEEYKARETQAQAFADGGYAGDMPQQVAAFATPAGLTPQAATDLILSQAVQLRGAQAQLGVLRMQKYAVFNAADATAALAAFNSIMAGIAAVRTALGG